MFHFTEIPSWRREAQVRWLSPSTQQRYVQAVARFARHFGRSPAHLGPEQIRAYQVYLTTDRRLAATVLLACPAGLPPTARCLRTEVGAALSTAQCRVMTAIEQCRTARPRRTRRAV